MLPYVPIGLQLAVAAALALGLLGLSAILGKPRQSRTDLSPYECGVEPFEAAGKRFTVRFYMVAMLFILFDIEAAFLYPWATAMRDMGMRGFLGAALFVAILLVGYAYCWRRGALEWD